MKILILGGTYFIGRHIASHLVSSGHDVTLLNRGTRVATLPTLHADRNDPPAMRAALAGHSFDVVIDTSCYDATQALIAEGALAGRYDKWLFLSSAAVYGDHAPRPLSERSVSTGSASFGKYGVHKAETERVLAELCGTNLTILRPAYVYGPGNNLARETFVWSRILCGEDIYLPGEGATRLSLIHVHDLVRAVQMLIEAPASRARTFNLAHPEPVTLREWVLTLAKQTEMEAQLQPVAMRETRIDARQFFPFRDLDLSLDVSRLFQETGFVAQFDLDAGLAQTFASYERATLVQELRSSSIELELGAARSATVSGEHSAVNTSPRQSSAS